MAQISLFQSAALAVLAAVGTMAAPALAHLGEPDNQEARQMRVERQAEARQEAPQQQEPQAPQAAPPQVQVTEGGRGWNRGGGGGEWQGRSEARQQQRAPAQQQAQASGDGRESNRGGERHGWQGRTKAPQQQAAPQQRSAPDGGWRSQRPAEGERYGRNWNNDGQVSRPAPAWRGALPQTPESGVTDQARAERWGDHDRNRTYSDPNRSGSYGGWTYDRSAQDWRNRQGDRSGTYRNGYSDGRSADNYRERHDQNYAYRNGYVSSSRDHSRWDNNDWRRDTRYNWSGYRNQHRDLYRAGRYYSPYNNYGYSRLSIGFFLNSGFYGQNYWINDPWQYRLPSVYGPYRWVRYYDDVLLVDIYSGEVVDVIHDFFW